MPDRDSSPSENCKVCERTSIEGSYLCLTCRRLMDRGETRRDEAGRAWPVDKNVRQQALKDQWDREAGAFRCYYTGIPLEDVPGRRYATWEHTTPGESTRVVLVADVINKMKSDMTESEFRSIVLALAERFKGEGFDESAFPADRQR